VPEWQLARLQPQNHRQVREIMYDSDEVTFTGIDAEVRAEDVRVGENLAYVSEDPNDSFWLMLVNRSCHAVVETFRDD
jgi:hypothetical protein